MRRPAIAQDIPPTPFEAFVQVKVEAQDCSLLRRFTWTQPCIVFAGQSQTEKCHLSVNGGAEKQS